MALFVGLDVSLKTVSIYIVKADEIKRLSASGELTKYRMVHFATHGLLAGQFDSFHEPGLILTPPATATEEDDGYLSASEIASLKLDADWVILSACNTAAGATTSAEALSGLAGLYLRPSAIASGVALGGLLGGHREADHDRPPRDGSRSESWLRGDEQLGAKLVDFGMHWKAALLADQNVDRQILCREVYIEEEAW